MSAFDDLKRLMNAIHVNPNNLEPNLEVLIRTFQNANVYVGMTTTHGISLIESLNVIKMVNKIHPAIHHKLTLFQLKIIKAIDEGFKIYKNSVEKSAMSILGDPIANHLHRETSAILASYYYSIQDYDKYLEYFPPSCATPVVMLAVAHVMCSQPDTDKALGYLKLGLSQVTLDTFVEKLETTHWEPMMSILIKIHQAETTLSSIKDYIDKIVIRLAVSIERITYIINNGYFSLNSFIRIGLYLIPRSSDNKCARLIVNKLRSLTNVDTNAKAKIKICVDLLDRNLPAIIDFINTPHFLTLTAQQRADIYVVAYTIQADTDIDNAILFLIEAMIVHNGLTLRRKISLLPRVIRYFAGTQGYHTYRFYLREFIIHRASASAEDIASVVSVCMSKQDYEFVDLLQGGLRGLALIRSLYHSDRPEDLKRAIQLITDDIRKPDADLPLLCKLMADICDKLQGILSGAPSLSDPSSTRKRALPADGTRLEVSRDAPDRGTRLDAPNFCRVCTVVVSGEMAVHEQLPKHTNKVTRFCFSCSKRFKTKTSLESHLLTCTGSQDTTFHCSACQSNFSSSQALSNHLNSKLHNDVILQRGTTSDPRS